MAGIEVIFFLVAGMGLCFGFLLKTVDNTAMFQLPLSRGYTVPRCSLLLTPSVRRPGVHKELGQDTARTTEQWNILYYMMSWLSI